MLRCLRKRKSRKIRDAKIAAVGVVSGLAIGRLVTLFTSKRSGKENRELVKDKVEHAKEVAGEEIKKISKNL